MRRVFAIVLMGWLMFSSTAQESGEADINAEPSLKFDDLEVTAGVLEGNFKSKEMVKHMEGRVKLVFRSKNSSENLRIDANAIDFFYEDSGSDSSVESADKSPTRMELAGDIVIEVQGMLIRSQKAEIDLKTMVAHFIGDTTIVMEGRDPITSDDVTINLDTGDYRMKNANIPSLDLVGPSVEAK